MRHRETFYCTDGSSLRVWVTDTEAEQMRRVYLRLGSSDHPSSSRIVRLTHLLVRYWPGLNTTQRVGIVQHVIRGGV